MSLNLSYIHKISSSHFDCSILSFQTAAIFNFRENRRPSFDSKYRENCRYFQNHVRYGDLIFLFDLIFLGLLAGDATVMLWEFASIFFGCC